jgi:hypothetical protein
MYTKVTKHVDLLALWPFCNYKMKQAAQVDRISDDSKTQFQLEIRRKSKKKVKDGHTK